MHFLKFLITYVCLILLKINLDVHHCDSGKGNKLRITFFSNSVACFKQV